MALTKEELRYLKAVLEKEMKHFSKDKKSIIRPEDFRVGRGEILLGKFQKDLLKKINKMSR